jgi:hypothetical protein
MGWSQAHFGSYTRALWALAFLELLFAGCLVWVRHELTRRADRAEKQPPPLPSQAPPQSQQQSQQQS